MASAVCSATALFCGKTAVRTTFRVIVSVIRLSGRKRTVRQISISIRLNITGRHIVPVTAKVYVAI